MPYTTLVPGTTQTASWANANVRDQGVTPFASGAARSSAITSPIEGMVTFLNDANTLDIYNGTNWISYLNPTESRVDAQESTTSTSFTNLSTTGPAVIVTTGTRALVIVGAHLFNSTTTNASIMGFDISGATSVSPSDPYSIWKNGTDAIEVGRTMLVSGLNPGNHTFTAKYKVGGASTGTFTYRTICVMPLP